MYVCVCMCVYSLVHNLHTNSLSYNCGEMELECEGKIGYDHNIEIAASSQNSLACESSGKSADSCQS